MTCFDLTRRLESGMPVYPGDPPVECDDWASHEEDGYRVSRLSLGTHAGTHVDAPAHTEPPGSVSGPYTIDGFPPEALEFSARLADATHRGDREAVERADLPALDGCDLVVVRTGWATHWGSDRYRNHPYLAPETARRLADASCSVALDTFGPDPTPSPNVGTDEPDGMPAHHALLGGGCRIVENLAPLDDVAAAVGDDAFALRAYPIPVAGGDGAPARVVAEV
jgi:kynurenine formamidase